MSAVPVEDAVAALSTFSLEDDQPGIQGLSSTLSSAKSSSESPIGFEDVHAYQLSLAEDTKAINHLESLLIEGKEMIAVLYTYRSCVKALPQLPDSRKQSQAELYLETYQVLDIEIGRLREIQVWQAGAASKLATDMHRFSRPERRLNGPTVTHMWCMLKLLDVLLQLDHLKNAKASIPNDFSWYKRTFTQVSTNWPDTEQMREDLDDLQMFLSARWAILLNIQAELFRMTNVEDILQVLMLFCLESLESDRVLLYSERHCLLRVLPVLVLLATPSEKDSDSFFKKVKVARLIRIFKRDPVIPAFPDLHLAPAMMLKELSPFFRRVAAQSRLVALPAPHELPPKDAMEYQKMYSVVHHMPAIRAAHDEFCLRFAAALNQLQLYKAARSSDDVSGSQIKQDMYFVIVEGFQRLSDWTGRIWEQCAWKFSRPAKDAEALDPERTAVSDYEKVVRYNYSAPERKALVELTSYIKGVGTMMEQIDTFVADTIWETVHAQVQDFVQHKLALMLRTSFKKKKEVSRILQDMRTIAIDWVGSSSTPDQPSDKKTKDEVDSAGAFRPRPAPPTAAQLHCLQFLIHELLSGSVPKKAGGFFGSTDSEIPAADSRQLESFFNKLVFFPHILDYRATLGHVTDLGFLWFREFYLETSRVIQFPIECSLPWMLVDHIIESQDAGLLESLLMPFDIYNDSAEYALRSLKQRFLYDEIEAEVDLCFDQLVFKLTDHMFGYYKSRAASKMLDPSFLAVSEDHQKYSVFPRRYEVLFKVRRVQLLGRTIDLGFLIAQRLNKVFRENLDFLLERFEAHDLCSIVELQNLVEILRLTHELFSEHLQLDSFQAIFSEMVESISLVSFSGRIAFQVFQEMKSDFLPNFILCNTTQRFVRSPKPCQKPIKRPAAPNSNPSFLCGTLDLNVAHAASAELYSKFFGLPHMMAIVKLLGSRSIPWLVRALLDHLSQMITGTLEPIVSELRAFLPKAINVPPSEVGVTGCIHILKEQLQWATNYEGKGAALQCCKEIGSIVFWISLLDTAMREVETCLFMQVAPWLGVVPGSEGQMQQLLADDGYSPLVSLFKRATQVVVANPACLSPNTFISMSKQAEVADLLYMNNLQTGSILDYTLAYLSAVLDSIRGKFNMPSKTGLIEITSTKEFHRVFSGLQFVYCGEPVEDIESNTDRFGDALAWGGCTVMYLLGQHLRFEMLDFIYHLLNVAKAEALSITQAQLLDRKQTAPYPPDLTTFLESAKRTRRLNSHVFSVLRARSPNEEKAACLVKQSGTVVHRIKYPTTPSAFDNLPLKEGTSAPLTSYDEEATSLA